MKEAENKTGPLSSLRQFYLYNIRRLSVPTPCVTSCCVTSTSVTTRVALVFIVQLYTGEAGVVLCFYWLLTKQL